MSHPYGPTSPSIQASAPAKKRRWKWAIPAVAALVIFGAVAGGGKDSSTTAAGETEITTTVSQKLNDAPVDTSVAGPEPTLAEQAQPAAVPAVAEAPQQQQSHAKQDSNDVPKEYKNALRKAKMYDAMHLSKAGLYRQLTSEYGEKYSADAAQYAVDNIDADWNAHALAKAKTYQDTMAMSPDGVYEQLVSEYGEQFTPEEAQYAVDHL